MKRVLHVLGPSRGGIRAHVRYLAEHPPDGYSTAAIAGPGDLAAFFEGLPFRPLGTGPPWRGLDVDLVHAHGVRAGALTLRRGARPPVVLTLHVYAVAGGRAPLVRLALRLVAGRVARKADALIAVSRELASRYPRAHVIPPAVALPGPPSRSRDDVRAELGAKPDDVVALAVARLHPDKALHRFVAAMRDLPAVGWIVGEGPQRPALERLTAGGNVRLLGHRADVSDLLHAADVFCLPSVGEGYGIAVVEAIGAGLPVVATRVGAIPEIVGDAGLIVAPDRPEEFALRLRQVVTDERLRSGLARAAVRPAALDVAGAVARIGAVYDEVLT